MVLLVLSLLSHPHLLSPPCPRSPRPPRRRPPRPPRRRPPIDNEKDPNHLWIVVGVELEEVEVGAMLVTAIREGVPARPDNQLLLCQVFLRL